jgi:hypothetical protein
VPARRQEQDQVEGKPERRRDPRLESKQDEQPDGDLGEGDSHAGRARERFREPADQEPPGCARGEPVQLRADPGRRSRVQEARVGELLPSRVDKRRAEEQAEREEGGGGIEAREHGPDANQRT